MIPKVKRGVSRVRARNSTLPTRWPCPGRTTIASGIGADRARLRGAMTAIPTSLVGSYAQPDWLIDREKLAGRFPPRVRARELWRGGARRAAEGLGGARP